MLVAFPLLGFILSFFHKTVGKSFFPSYLESTLKDLCAIVKTIATSRYNSKYYTECLQVLQKVFIGNRRTQIWNGYGPGVPLCLPHEDTGHP